MANVLNDKMLNGDNIQFSPTDELLLTAYSKGEVGHFKIKIGSDYGRNNFEFRFIKGMSWEDFIGIFDSEGELFEEEPNSIRLKIPDFDEGITLNSTYIQPNDLIVDDGIYFQNKPER